MKTKRVICYVGISVCTALVAAVPATNAHSQDVSVGVSVSTPNVQISAVADFYEPLSPYGRWEVIESHGRCWVPSGIAADWTPYSVGYWQWTDAGWFWVSSEPFGWATYHYGRWDFVAGVGWYWIPRTEWAPAWVSWRQGGGYIGWAPLGFTAAIAPAHYVFVEERHFLEPVTPQKVIVKNTTIINKTKNISVTNVENNTTVIKQGPQMASIEKASGKKIQKAEVREVRATQEANVKVAKSKNAPAEQKRGAAEAPVQTNRNETFDEEAPAQTERSAPAPQQPGPEKKQPEAKSAPQNEQAAPAQKPNSAKESTPPQKPKGSGKKAPQQPSGEKKNAPDQEKKPKS